MRGGWLRLFSVPGCFHSHSSHARSQVPIMPTFEGEEIEVTEEVELNTGDSMGLTLSTSPSSPAPSSSEFYSPRIAGMIEKLKSKPGMDKVESEVEASKVHWSELSTSSVLGGDALAAENKRVFKSLQKQWPCIDILGEGFFEGWEEGEWEVGEKIAEGGQAELFELWEMTPEGKRDEWPYVIKMFKEGLSLQDLQRLLPHGMLADSMLGFFDGGLNCNSILGAMLFNGRFALLMGRKWGDLRKMIDGRMIHNRMEGPPFTAEETAQCMLGIARGMKGLHKRNIIHRDLKAANVLLEDEGNIRADLLEPPMSDQFECLVADYECSVGVVGTGFWRAPEILLAVKNGHVTPELFSKASDVYSYGMICYEILTGCVPFEREGLKLNEYDRVISGYRPTLPSQTSQWMMALLRRCWHKDPLERPTFKNIVGIIVEERWKKRH